MTQRAEGGGKPITCSGKQQLSCKAIPPGLDALTTARVGICRPMGFRHLRCPKVSKGRAESPLVRPQAHTPCHGGEGRADYGANGGAAAPSGAVLSFEAKESTKESTRHGDSRGGPPRCALFANIGVPGTAVPGSCICSGLPVANCLRQLCPLGTRSLSAQASVCGSRTVGCPE